MRDDHSSHVADLLAAACDATAIALLISAGIGLVVCMALNVDVADAAKRAVLVLAAREHQPTAISIADARYG